MKQKLFLLSTSALAVLANAQTKETKPNILWVVIEDTSPQFIGCYGNKDARTPVMDGLAREGVRFTNAFCAGTVSSASRSCLITGVKTYLMGTGNHRSDYPIPEYIKGFPYYLQQAGYYTSNNSKTDYNVANAGKFTKEAWNESSDKAGWWNRQPGQPFFAVFNFMDSHQSRTMTQSYNWYLKNVIDQLPVNERIAEDKFEMPPFYYDSPEMRKQFARVYNSIKLTDNKIAELLNRLDKDHLRDSTIIFFYADNGEGIPRGKTNGINLGFRTPFVIWFPEMYKNLSPWGKSGVVTDELIDFADLPPTVISLAGGTIPGHMTGHAFLGEKRSARVDHLNLSEDRSDNGIDVVRNVTNGKYFYSRNYMPFMPEVRDIHYMEIGDIKKQMRQDFAANKLNTLQKKLFEDRPAEFLFDIENDVWETKNLATDPAYKSVMDTMRNQLKAEIFQSRDIMLLPENELVEISKTTTPYQFRLDQNKYPLEEIYDAVSLSGFRGKDITAKQIKLLQHSNNVVRYWAMIGLRAQSSKDLKSYKKVIVKAMNDAYQPVAITASAIAYEEFENEEAKENLKNFSFGKNDYFALMAVNYMLYVTNKQPFIETMQKLQTLKGLKYEVKAASLDFLGN
ncbi:MAG: sulfatase, partial [Bacteroidia bacterium]|nr:sulfatase [Bacteroidia bacterium]